MCARRALVAALAITVSPSALCIKWEVILICWWENWIVVVRAYYLAVPLWLARIHAFNFACIASQLICVLGSVQRAQRIARVGESCNKLHRWRKMHVIAVQFLPAAFIKRPFAKPAAPTQDAIYMFFLRLVLCAATSLWHYYINEVHIFCIKHGARRECTLGNKALNRLSV